jgi:hypothetical protein
MPLQQEHAEAAAVDALFLREFDAPAQLQLHLRLLGLVPPLAMRECGIVTLPCSLTFIYEP